MNSNYKVTINCLCRKRKSEGEKNAHVNFTTEEYMAKDQRLDLNQRLDYSGERYEGYGYDYEFNGIPDIQMNIQSLGSFTKNIPPMTKTSLGSFTELPPDLREKTKTILNIRSNKYNCFRLCVTAAFYFVTEHATRENKYIISQVEDWDLMNITEQIQNKLILMYGFIDLYMIVQKWNE